MLHGVHVYVNFLFLESTLATYCMHAMCMCNDSKEVCILIITLHVSICKHYSCSSVLP